MIEPNPRDLIRNEFMARKSRNGRYSLRAYALFLDVPVATLCRYLNARGDIKSSECFRILRRLNFVVVREDPKPVSPEAASPPLVG